MPAREGLGETHNVVPFADGVWLSMRDCAAIDFVCLLAGAVGDTYTVAEATTLAGGGSQNLARITQWYTSAGAGATQWVRNAQAAAATVVTAAAAAENTAVFTVREEQLSDGYSYVKVTSTGAGVVVALPHRLKVQRTPANLAAVSA